MADSRTTRQKVEAGLAVLAHNVQTDNVEYQRHDKQNQTQGESSKRLGAVKLLVTDQQRNDLHSDRRYCFKGVCRQVCSKARGHDDDHRLTDRPGNRQQDLRQCQAMLPAK